MAWQIGVDVGGTFTDFHAVETATGARHTFKHPSTPTDPAEAVLAGLDLLAARGGVAVGEAERLAHGTTVATNTLIERTGAKLALVTTAGFQDLLEVGRQTRPHMFDLHRDRPAPLVPRAHRLTATERLDAAGQVVTPLTEAEAQAVAERVRATGAEACAVVFLFGFLNPVHEDRMAAALEAACPGMPVARSSVVQPEFREYERSATTAINAYLQPAVGRYLGRLADGVGARAPTAQLGINQSSGGLMSPEQAARFPIRTALSGPAAGATGAAHVAAEAGVDAAITLDVGGTSADVCLIRDGRPAVTFERSVAGFPVRQPSVDVHTVGAGGGSIGWRDAGGRLKVGPASAGADPGPACYGRGGTAPTVSDANLVLGRLPGGGLLGGDMVLDGEAAAQAIDVLAQELGYSRWATARGMLDVVTATMVRAIRTITVERGHDPRRFSLLAYGGAGPLQAVEVARALGIARVVVPASPGILCARGLLVADLQEHFVSSGRTVLAEAAGSDLAGAVADLAQRATAWFERERIAAGQRHWRLSADMRYVGQNFELNVLLDESTGTQAPRLPEADALVSAFFEAHEQAYGFYDPTARVELMALRLTVRGRLHAPPEPPGEAPPACQPAPAGHQDAVVTGDHAAALAVYHRATMTPGATVPGPAIVAEFDATTFIGPADTAHVDAAGHLVIRVGDAHG